MNLRVYAELVLSITVLADEISIGPVWIFFYFLRHVNEHRKHKLSIDLIDTQILDNL